MTYSCSDFTDSVIEALGLEIPEESNDSPSDQFELAIIDINRLQRFAVQTVLAVQLLQIGHDVDGFIARMTNMAENLDDPIFEVANELYAEAKVMPTAISDYKGFEAAMWPSDGDFWGLSNDDFKTALAVTWDRLQCDAGDAAKASPVAQ